MDRHASSFLTARWLNLTILNFEIDPDVLAPLVPLGTELDTWHGKTLVSIVGFLFRDLRVWELPIPFHQSFEEVNLRFYVRRKSDEGWRRGVVFVKEFAPRRIVGWAARWFYGENYSIVPMAYRGEVSAGDLETSRSVSFLWNLAGSDNRLELSTAGEGRLAAPGSEEEFIIEHYWGYSGGADRRTLEYRVDHPRWKLWQAREARFAGDVERLYGPSFVESLSAAPTSAFLADGSSVTVFKGAPIDAAQKTRRKRRSMRAVSDRYTDAADRQTRIG